MSPSKEAASVGNRPLDRLRSAIARASYEDIATAIAADHRPDLRLDQVDAALDALADTVPGAPEGMAGRTLAQALFGQEGPLRGNADDYYDPQNSYIDAVLERGLGIPITLTVILAAVGRRCGVAVEGVGFPGHFLARVGGPNGVLVDPFSGGRVLEGEDIATLAQRFLGDLSRLRPEHLREVTAHELAVRMLANLQRAHERRGDHGGALISCDRLFELTAAPESRRDRGMHALVLGATESAADDLAAYLDARPAAKDAPVVQRALDRAKAAQTVVS